MEFDFLVQKINTINNVTLPSVLSHNKMMPKERLNSTQTINLKKAKKACVMMLLYPINGETHFVLIERTAYKGVHSAQIAFPGGKVEKTDGSLQNTALRETFEEIGVSSKLITVIKPFSSIYIEPSNFEVFPFLGISKTRLTFIKQDTEVSNILEINLELLLNDANLQTQNIDTSYGKLISVPVFKFNDTTVWGATAMMLSELKDVLKMVL